MFASKTCHPEAALCMGRLYVHFFPDCRKCVRYQKRAHNPLLIAAGFANTEVSVPWLGDKRLRLVFG
jgi:hypothetical protein